MWHAATVTHPPRLCLADALAFELIEVGPRADPTRAMPVGSAAVLNDDSRAETEGSDAGEGTSPAGEDGVCETLGVVAGAATCTGADADAVVLRLGVTVHQPDGRHGTWDVAEPMRTVDVVIATR